MYRYYLALRFMVSRPINLLGMVAVMLGVWALIVVVSIFDGYRIELKRHFAMTVADVSIYNLGDDADYGRVAATVGAVSNVASCAPRLVWAALIHPRKRSEMQTWVPGAVDKSVRFVTLTGIDAASEAKTTGFPDWLARVGEEHLRVDLATLVGGQDWLLVSRRRAQNQGLQRGAVLTVTTGRVHYKSSSSNLTFANGEFPVAGAFESRHAGYDELTAFLPIDDLRRLVAADDPGFINEVAVKLVDTSPAAVEQTTARLARALYSDPQFRHARPRVVAAGQESSEHHFIQAIEHQSDLMKVILFVIMVVAGFLVYATLSMMVSEKVHDIGVIAALGGTRAGVLQVFLTSGFAITLTGTLAGALTGCLTAIRLDAFNGWMKRTFGIDLFPPGVYNLPEVPYHLDPWWIAEVAGGSLALGLIVSFLPAWRAMRHDPLQCLRDR